MKETKIVALEIGSSKIKGALGVVDSNGTLTVQAVEEEPIVDWVRYGVVSNAEEVARHTMNLLDRLESKLNGETIQGVYVNIGSRSLRADKVQTETNLIAETEITADILDNLYHEAAAQVSSSRDLLDVVPNEYLVNKTRVTKPIGSLGQSVRMISNIITCRPQIKRNLNHLLVEKLNLDVIDYKVRQIVEADFVLSPEEKRLGCMFVDCGAETTTVSIYKQGHLQSLTTIPMGSRNITRDLMHLNYLEERAEEIKRHFGHAYGAATATASAGIDLTDINKYVAARAGEIIANIKEQLKYAGFEPTQLPAGIVVVGRGARLAGFCERLAETTQLKVRSGANARQDIRMADPRISVTDAVDVISILYAASKKSPCECTCPPEPAEDTKPVEQPSTAASVNDNVKNNDNINDTRNTSKQRKGIMRSLRERIDRITGILEDDNFDDDEEVMRDDI